MNPKNWVNIGFAATAVVGFFIFDQVLGFVWSSFRFPLYEEWVVPLPQLVAFVLALIVFWGLEKSRKAVGFTTEVVAELSKVTWPVKKETFFSTLIVVVMVGLASVVLFLFDTMWGSVVQKFLAF